MPADLELCFAPATELARRIRVRELSPVELMRNYLARIDEVNPRLNCFCFVYPDEAMALASAAEQAVMRGDALGPMHGLPVAIKDVTPTAGKITTRGSRMYEHWVPEQDALIVQRLRAAGAIMLGKTTTPEFAHDGFTASPLWGVTRNPWNPARTPGGSSGGSGAAVAAGCAALAEGTDMGGSVRIPAALCGLVGLKPSLGRIPMDILPTVFDNISHFGPLTRSIGDANLFMNVTAGPWERDIMSLPQRLEFPLPPASDVRGLTLGLSMDLGFFMVDADVQARVRAAADALREAGAEVIEVNPGWDQACVEAWDDNWCVYLDVCFTQDFETWRERMDPNLVKLIEHGRTLDAAAMKRIEVVRTRQWHRLCEVFEKVDALLCPTMTRTAPPLAGTDADFHRPAADGRYYALDMTSVFNNVAQCPALTVPAGFGDDGLPVGLQIVGHRFDDLTVMRIGAALEQAQPWHGARPEAGG